MKSKLVPKHAEKHTTTHNNENNNEERKQNPFSSKQIRNHTIEAKSQR